MFKKEMSKFYSITCDKKRLLWFLTILEHDSTWCPHKSEKIVFKSYSAFSNMPKKLLIVEACGQWVVLVVKGLAGLSW